MRKVKLYKSDILDEGKYTYDYAICLENEDGGFINLRIPIDGFISGEISEEKRRFFDDPYNFCGLNCVTRGHYT
jgi:hypothetical protein